MDWTGLDGFMNSYGLPLVYLCCVWEREWREGNSVILFAFLTFYLLLLSFFSFLSIKTCFQLSLLQPDHSCLLLLIIWLHNSIQMPG